MVADHRRVSPRHCGALAGRLLHLLEISTAEPRLPGHRMVWPPQNETTVFDGHQATGGGRNRRRPFAITNSDAPISAVIANQSVE